MANSIIPNPLKIRRITRTLTFSANGNADSGMSALRPLLSAVAPDGFSGNSVTIVPYIVEGHDWSLHAETTTGTIVTGTLEVQMDYLDYMFPE